VFWLVQLLGDLLCRDTGAVELRVNNKSALVKNPIFYERSKHIRVRYHFIRGCLEEGSFKACYINTKDQLADLLTKPLWEDQVPLGLLQDWDGPTLPQDDAQDLRGE
jgi:hypothetical protein